MGVCDCPTPFVTLDGLENLHRTFVAIFNALTVPGDSRTVSTYAGGPQDRRGKHVVYSQLKVYMNLINWAGHTRLLKCTLCTCIVEGRI